MAAAVAGDPQFVLPVRPRWVDGLVQVPVERGLLVEGGPERQVLRGAAATALLPRLIPLLDGTRDIAAVAGEVGLRDALVRQAVSLLYSCGLLEDGADPDAGAAEGHPVAHDVLRFLSRQVDGTRANRSAGGAVARLARARVVVLGRGPLAARLAEDARATGVADVAQASGLGALDAEVALVVAVVAPGEDRALVALDDRCAELAVPWLRVAPGDAEGEIGPRFERAHTACLDCFVSLRERADADGSAASGAEATVARTATGADAEVLAGLAGLEIAHLVTRVGAALSPRGVTRVDLATLAQRTLPLLRRPGCARCCPGPGEARSPTLGVAYEQSVVFPPRALLDPKDHQVHYKPANLRLQREAKDLPGAARVALPDPDEDGEGQGLGLGVLGGLLLRAFGLREPGAMGTAPKVERWAPTGGNLGSTTAYVLAARVAGVAPGAYCYLAREHTLARLPAPGPADQPAAAGPAATIVVTGALGRVAAKYGPFGYRIVLLDAGCAVAQLATVAAAAGIGIEVAARWDDHGLARRLGVDADTEPVTAVVGLHEGRDDDAR